MADCYSCYPEVIRLTSTSASIITVMKSVFSWHGISHTVVSDNGPQHVSAEMKKFSSLYGFNHVTTSLRAMKISSQFNLASDHDKSLFTRSPSILADKMPYPESWTWFWVENPTTIAYTQDMVHIAVKMKSRLLKPSTILPMGDFTAGVHHLQILVESFAKEQHGICHKDIDCKHKQNYEAVLHISSPTALNLLKQLPDVLRSFIDGFLDKQLSVSNRVYKVWYVVFFLRYWQRWIKLSKAFSIKNNFITTNAVVT